MELRGADYHPVPDRKASNEEIMRLFDNAAFQDIVAGIKRLRMSLLIDNRDMSNEEITQNLLRSQGVERVLREINTVLRTTSEERPEKEEPHE